MRGVPLPCLITRGQSMLILDTLLHEPFTALTKLLTAQFSHLQQHFVVKHILKNEPQTQVGLCEIMWNLDGWSGKPRYKTFGTHWPCWFMWQTIQVPGFKFHVVSWMHNHHPSDSENLDFCCEIPQFQAEKTSGIMYLWAICLFHIYVLKEFNQICWKIDHLVRWLWLCYPTVGILKPSISTPQRLSINPCSSDLPARIRCEWQITLRQIFTSVG